MANYLLTLTIANVQHFIAQARTSRDLFAGSAIVSNLMKAVLGSEVLVSHNAQIIFPYFGSEVSTSPNNEDKSSFPNKMICKIETTEDKIKKIGKALEACINQECMMTILETTQKGDRSLNNFFQVYWVAVELDDDYQSSYKQLEKNLGAIKNLRTFHQEGQVAGVQKCSLCGQRNFAQENQKDKLCLVCLTKRNYKKEKTSYPSTAKIALLDWLKKVPNQNEYEKLFQKPFDESLYFKENVSKEYLTKWGYFKSDDDLQKAIKFLDDLEIEVKQKKHYALIQFDIDNLGKRLSELNEKSQKKLSEKLGEFAGKAKTIVDKYGKTVYAGGDDFLGFVNLKYLFRIIDDLYCDFASMELDLTFSTSIIIAHYKTPLHKVLDFSRSLLDETKNHFDDKNALGMQVMNGSAVIAKTIGRYEDLKLLEELKKADIGAGLHLKLHATFDYLDTMSFDAFLTQKEMIKVEIKRLLKREEGEFHQELYDKLISFFGNQTLELSTNSYQIDFDNFIGYLKTLEQLKKVM